MDLVHVWCDDRYWSKILHSAIPTPIHDFMKFYSVPSPTPIHDSKVKVMDLELLC